MLGPLIACPFILMGKGRNFRWSLTRWTAPLWRQIAEAFDVPVVWDEAAQQATIQRGEETLVLRLGSQTALYNGVEVPLPIKPQTKADVTFLPLRYVAEWLQLQVEFKDGAAYLQPAELGDTPDTLTLPKGNSNANLAAGGDMLLWQDKIYFRYRMYIEGLACTADVVRWTPETDDFNPARPTPKYEILLPGDNYSHFNVWQGEVYAICNNNFVKLGADFKPAATLVENVCYAQIQDGWLYSIAGGLAGAADIADGQPHLRLCAKCWA